MIRLASLLREISFGGVAPYVTQFTCELMGSTGLWKCVVNADSLNVEFIMAPGENIFARPGENIEWYFAFTLPTRNPNSRTAGRTTSHTKSGAAGQLNYLRLIRTAGEAILDFCVNHAPESINISGADSDADKESQKTRLYAAFVRDNASRLSTAGYTSMQRGDQLWLVRTSTADTTGIEND